MLDALTCTLMHQVSTSGFIKHWARTSRRRYFRRLCEKSLCLWNEIHMKCQVKWLSENILMIKEFLRLCSCFDHGYQGPVSIWRCRLTSIGVPIIKIRLSHDRLILILEIPYRERQYLYWHWAQIISDRAQFDNLQIRDAYMYSIH